MTPLLVALALMGGSRVVARQCNTAHQAYVQPVQYQAYAAPVAAVQTYYTPVVREVQFVAVEPPYGAYGAYYSSLVGTSVRAEKQLADQASDAADLKAQVSRLADTVKGLSDSVRGATSQPATPAPAPTPPPPAPTSPMPPAPDIPPPDPTPAVTPAPPPVTPTSATARAPDSIVLLFRARCATCHTAGSAKGGFTLFTADGSLADLTPTQKVKVDIKTYSGAMPPPPKGKPLDPTEYSAVRAWINESADEIVASLNKK